MRWHTLSPAALDAEVAEAESDLAALPRRAWLRRMLTADRLDQMRAAR